MKTLAIAVLFLAAAAPSHARTDFELELNEARRETIANARKDAAKASDAMRAAEKSKTETHESETGLHTLWRKMLIAIGADSNDRQNYPSFSVRCAVLIDFKDGSDLPCGDKVYLEQVAKEDRLHRVLSHQAEEQLREMYYKAISERSTAEDRAAIARRVEAIRDALEGMRNFPNQLSNELDNTGRTHRYLYDQKCQKDSVDKEWAMAAEMAEMLQTRMGKKAGKS